MSFVTVEVQIEKGQVVPRGSEPLPEKGHGLLTILSQSAEGEGALRPTGLAKGEFTVPADFNVPLPDALLKEFEGV
jgi:hypothetical protein